MWVLYGVPKGTSPPLYTGEPGHPEIHIKVKDVSC